MRGVDPKQLNEIYPLEANVIAGELSALNDGSFNVALGTSLAQSLGLNLHDKVTLLIPDASSTIAGVTPKFKRLTVAAIFRTGTAYDDRNGFINICDADRLFKMHGGVTGIQMRLADELNAPQIVASLHEKLGQRYWITDWSTEYSSFFEALKMEKMVMWCILCLIIAVAAFNLVSSLVMMVTDKRVDIAILRTMGATAKDVMGIFFAQGAIIGLVGTLLGLIFGLLLAYNVTAIVEYIQNLFNVQFVAEDVYLIGFVPSQIKYADVVFVCGISFVMSLLATIYPSWRAANIAPAEALRYE